MKKLFVLMSLLAVAFAAHAQDTISAFLTSNPPMTRILNKPMGAKVMTLDYYNCGEEENGEVYIMSVASPQDGWWKIVELWTIEDDVTSSLTGSDTSEYWIHYSDLGLNTRNYGGQEIYLRDAPDEDANIVYTTDEEIELKPMDIQGDWVKVKVDGYDIVGWIEAEWLCSNPLTNCS